METSKGMVSDSKRMSVHDGPGIRTTLFLKGCPLRCLWCHNPENLQTKPALSFTRKLCIGCGACARGCPGGLHSFPGKEHHIRFDACSGCGACTEECLPGALKLYGREMEPKEAARLLLEDRDFYVRSGGGVTFSGGEPFSQAEPFTELAKLLKANGYEVASYTGYTFEELLENGTPAQKQLLAALDILVDGEFVLAQRNLDLRFRGSENQRILDVPQSLAQGRAVWCTAARWVGERQS